MNICGALVQSHVSYFVFPSVEIISSSESFDCEDEKRRQKKNDLRAVPRDFFEKVTTSLADVHTFYEKEGHSSLFEIQAPSILISREETPKELDSIRILGNFEANLASPSTYYTAGCVCVCIGLAASNFENCQAVNLQAQLS